MQLDEISARIDRAFGEELPIAGRPLVEAELQTLQHLLRDETYQDYLQDQVSRQIIRDYLTNAVLLGYLAEDGLADFSTQVASHEGRIALSLHMLMSSVEDADSLGQAGAARPLQPLQLDSGSAPSLTLVPK